MLVATNFHTYKNGVLIFTHLVATTAELKKWDESKWELNGQYHLYQSYNKLSKPINSRVSLYNQKIKSTHLLLVQTTKSAS